MSMDAVTTEKMLIAQGRDLLSGPQRLGHVALLAAALAMAATLASLLATEVGLPTRTVAAFAVMLAMALAWAAYAGWVLTRRRPLYGRHRVTASGMGTLFASLYTAGAGALWIGGGGAVAATAGFIGLILTAAGLGLLVQARRRVRDLEALRRELEGGA